MDITERLEKTYDLLRGRGGMGVHPGWVREGIQAIVEEREKNRILEHENRILKQEIRESITGKKEDEEPFSHSEEKSICTACNSEPCVCATDFGGSE